MLENVKLKLMGCLKFRRRLSFHSTRRKSKVYSPLPYSLSTTICFRRRMRGLINQRNNCLAFKVYWKLVAKGKAKDGSSDTTAVLITFLSAKDGGKRKMKKDFIL